MSEIIIGKVSLSPCGEFQYGNFYKRLSVVGYLGSYYIAIQDNQNIYPNDSVAWSIMSEVGDTISNIVLVSISDKTSNYRINFNDGNYFDFSIVNNLVAKTSEITNDSSFITAQVNNLDNYITKANSASSIQFSFNTETYVITVQLLNSNNEVISTQTITLPLGNTIRNATYNNATILLTQRDGSNITIPINDLIPTSRTIAGLNLGSNINDNDLAEALSVYTKTQLNSILEPINQELLLIQSNYFEQKGVEVTTTTQLNDCLNGNIDINKIGYGAVTQSTAKRSYYCGGTETGDYYFTYSNVNYQFTMPAIVAGDLLIFDTSTLKLYLGNTEIATTNDNTGTLITFIGAPNSRLSQDIVDMSGTQHLSLTNKNIFDYTKHDSLRLSSNGAITTTKYVESGTSVTYYLKPNTVYTLSYRALDKTTYIKTGLSTYINGYWLQMNSGHNKFTTKDNGITTIKIGASNYAAIGYYYAYIQLEEGNTVTEYVAHKGTEATLRLGNIRLGTLGTYNSYLYKSENSWHWYHEWDAYVMNGTEYWSQRVNNNGLRQFGGAQTGRASALLNNAQKCNYGIFNSATFNFGNRNSFCVDHNDSYIRINVGLNTDETTISLADWKTLLSTNNLISYFPLKNVADVEITAASYSDLYSDLQQLDNLKTFLGITNVSIGGSNPNGILDFIYWFDNRNVINNKIKTLESQVALLE